MRAQKAPHARRYWAALLFLMTGTLAGAWHNRATDRGKQDVVSSAVRMGVAPPARAAGGVSRWFGDQAGWLLHGRSLEAENQKLRTRVEELEGQTAELAEAQRENEQLRADLKFVQVQKRDLLAADVIARRADPNFDTILISRGSRDGVHVNSIVRTRNGLVGKVSEVSLTTATVILLTDPNGGVGARVQRPASNAVGVCKGDYSPLLPLLDLAGDADIKPGDVVVTSGFSTVVPGGAKNNPNILQTYPKGIPIGTVVSVKGEEGSISKVAVIRPGVDFDRLETVFVLP